MSVILPSERVLFGSFASQRRVREAVLHKVELTVTLLGVQTSSGSGRSGTPRRYAGGVHTELVILV